jgi:hypothetical protein
MGSKHSSKELFEQTVDAFENMSSQHSLYFATAFESPSSMNAKTILHCTNSSELCSQASSVYLNKIYAGSAFFDESVRIGVTL